MKLSKLILTAIALWLSTVSISAQIYPPGVSIRIYQPEEGGHIQLINNNTQQEISSFEVHINQGFENEERYFFASVPPFTPVKVNVVLESNKYIVKEILLNNQPLPFENPIFQGWRDGELYDVSAVIENTEPTSVEAPMPDDTNIHIFYNGLSNSIEITVPEYSVGTKVELFALSGKRIAVQTILNTKTNMQAPGTAGIYFVRFGSQAKKILINH